MAEQGRVIILNGGSSAGKTTLGKTLQDLLLPEPYLLLGIDAFWMALPPRQLDLDQVEPGYYRWITTVENGLEYFRIIPGPILDQAMRARYRAIAQFLDEGLNVIADDVIWKREWLLDALEILAPYRVLMVGVFVSDAEGARREVVRGDRHPGWDRGSARYAHHDAIYDLTIDTTTMTPEQEAVRVKHALDSNPQGEAFGQMRRKLLGPGNAGGVS
jgi:chloramphenicol 3-O phosphotransferase